MTDPHYLFVSLLNVAAFMNPDWLLPAAATELLIHWCTSCGFLAAASLLLPFEKLTAQQERSAGLTPRFRLTSYFPMLLK